MAKKEESGDAGKKIEALNKKIDNLNKKFSSSTSKAADDMADSYSDATDYAQELLTNMQRQKDLQEGIRKLQWESLDYTQLANDAAAQGNKELEKELRLLSESAKFQAEQAEKAKEALESRKEFLELGEAGIKKQKELLELEEKYSEAVKESLGFVDDITDSIEEIPIVGGILSKALGTEELKDQLAEIGTKHIAEMAQDLPGVFASAGGGMKGFFAAAGTGFAAVGTMIKSMLTSLAPMLPLIIAVAAVAKALEESFAMDKEVTEMARGLGMSKDEATEIHHELIHIAEDTKVVGANAEAMGAAYMDLAKGLGVTKLASAEMAESQVLLTKQMGMSTDEAVAFQKMSLASGKTAEQNLAIIKAGTEAASGGLFNYKEIAKEIAMTGADIQAGYKGDIKLLTKAVNTAKKLGITMEQAKGISESLLDVESSLQNEMTAQVLTGKTLNFDSARQLALQGDIAGAAAEVLDQVGGMAEYNNMNVVQQEALAKAAGMTRAELADTLKTQEAQRSIAESLGIAYDTNHKFTEKELAAAEKLGNKEAEKLMLQQQQTEASEKLAAMGSKLMTVFMKVADPIMEMLDPLMNLIDFVLPAIQTGLNIAFIPLKAIGSIISGMVQGLSYVVDLMTEYSGIAAGILTVITLITIQKNAQAILDAAAVVREGVILAYKEGRAVIEGIISGELLAQGAATIANLGKTAIEGAMTLGKAIASIFGTFAQIPFGIGIPLAIAAVGGLVALFNSAISDTGDLAMGANGGPIVTNPREGTIFQGTKNDEVAMGPGVIEAAQSSNGMVAVASNTSDSTSNTEVVALLRELIAKVEQPVNINISNKTVDTLGRQISMRKTYASNLDQSYGVKG